MKGASYFLRNFTATAVREHLRSQIEDSGGSPELTKNELELVRFICEGSFDWRAFLAAQRLRRRGGPAPSAPSSLGCSGGSLRGYPVRTLNTFVSGP
jgi:hypothetical protein